MKIKVRRTHIWSGKPLIPKQCPVALAIQDATGSQAIVSISDVVLVRSEAVMQLPVEARDFIRRFDTRMGFWEKLFEKPFTFELAWNK